MTKAAKIPSAIDGASKKHTTEQSSKHSSTDKDGLRNRKKNETTTISSEVATETNDSSTKIDKHAKGTGKSGNNTKKKLEAKPSSWTWSGLIGTITGYVATLAAIAYIGVMGYHFFHLFHPEGAGPEDVGREYYNSFKDGEALDVYTYLTTGHRVCSGFIDNATESLNASTCVLVWNPKNIRYGYHNETMKQVVRLNSHVLDSVRKAKNLQLHIYAVRASYLPHPSLGKYDPNELSLASGNLMRSIVPRKVAVNLLGLEGEEKQKAQAENDRLDAAESAEHLGEDEALAPKRDPEWHLSTEANLGLVYDATVYAQGKFPGDVLRHFRLISQPKRLYKPIMYFNGFWLGESKFFPLRNTTQSNLEIVLEPISLGKFRLTNSMEMGTNLVKKQMGFTDKDMDAVRDLITRNSPTFLMLTLFVSIVHLLFDFLAAKNEVGYWRKRKTNQGISSRAVVGNAVGTGIVFLYLMDNDTSMLILVPTGFQVVIDLWKVKKVLKMSLRWDSSSPIPISFDFGKMQKSEAETEAADIKATRWMMYLLYPLMAGYAVYSLIYDQHHGWYSWLLNTLTGYFYAFGFIAMMPQLFINHRLKSVAHLPWRALCYKAFNTFIDDIFAFLIHMPNLHRMACFRDDVIFFCFLYQLYIYPVDPTRVNEFGMSLEPSASDDEDDGDVSEKEHEIAGVADKSSSLISENSQKETNVTDHGNSLKLELRDGDLSGSGDANDTNTHAEIGAKKEL